MKLLQLLAGGRHRQVDVQVPASGRALLNFGLGSAEARVAITGQAGILATSTVTAQRLIAATANHTADEHLVEDLEVVAGLILPGVGFTIVGRPTRPTRLYGLFNVSWTWS